MNRSDPELIQACRDGDRVAWDQLVTKYGRLVYSIPRRYGMSEADADDVFAAVWATVFRKLAELRDQTRLSAWLITSTHRECWRVGKRSSASATSSELDRHYPDLGSPHEDLVETWERQHLVRRGLEQLGGKCQELLVALFMGSADPDYQAIGERLAMPVGSIGPTRTRCFKKLEAILRELGVEGHLDAGG